jgi:hypothetical protein
VDAETRDLAAGNDFTLDADISPTTLIALGLDLEAEQYVYLSRAKSRVDAVELGAF